MLLCRVVPKAVNVVVGVTYVAHSCGLELVVHLVSVQCAIANIMYGLFAVGSIKTQIKVVLGVTYVVANCLYNS